MKKSEFMKVCDRHIWGEDEQGGKITLKLMVGPDPNERYGGDYGIYLIGWNRTGIRYRIYTPAQVPGRQGEWSELRAKAEIKCRQQIRTYQKWLDEWKANNPPQKHKICDQCNGPEPDCWCDAGDLLRDSEKGGRVHDAAEDEGLVDEDGAGRPVQASD